MTSPYIEASKHPDFTAEVTKHFAGGNQGQKPGTDRLLKASPGGDTAWNGVDSPLHSEAGVNYTRPDQGGHTVK